MIVDENENPFQSRANFCATEPSRSKVGRISAMSADRLEKDEWSKDGDFESLQTATDASTYHWARNKNVARIPSGLGG